MPAHPRLRARVLHAVRDPRARWKTCSARIASRCSSERRQPRESAADWWERTSTPSICSSTSPSSPRARSARSRAADRGARRCPSARASSTSRAGRGGTRTCSPRRGSTSTDSTTRSTCSTSRGSAAPGRTLRYTRGDMRKLPGAVDGALRRGASTSSRPSASSPIPADDARVIARVRARAQAGRRARLARREPRRRDGAASWPATGGRRTTAR